MLNHLHTNIIASIDLETTGTVPGYHEIVQIAVVPLGNNLEPVGTPFNRLIKPEFPDRADPKALEINGLGVEALADEPDGDKVSDLLDEWFTGLGCGGRIIPLAHNYIFEHGFLNAWLGAKQFNRLFHYLPRDGMLLALSLKDKCALAGLPEPFNSVSLTNLCEVYGIVNEKPHDALADAIAEAKLYRALLGF